MKRIRSGGVLIFGAMALLSLGCGGGAPATEVSNVGRTEVMLISYDEAMQKPVDVGDASSECPERQLDDAQVVTEMDRHLDAMYRECVVSEYKRGGTLDTVTIDIAILGDGSVQGASASPGSKRFRSCIVGVVEDVRFPKFDAPRMGARYQFHTS